MAKAKMPDQFSEYLRKIGSKGGKRRMDTMTAAERKAIAQKAAAKSAEVRSKKAKNKTTGKKPSARKPSGI
jgi:hypothetical protein